MSQNQMYIIKKNKKIKLNTNSRNKMAVRHFKSLASGKTLCVGAIINDDPPLWFHLSKAQQLDPRRHGGQRSVLRFAVFTDNNLSITLFVFLSDLSQKRHPGEASVASVTRLFLLPTHLVGCFGHDCPKKSPTVNPNPSTSPLMQMSLYLS